MDCRIYRRCDIIFVIIFYILNTASTSSEDFFNCGPGLTSPGVTHPKGDIIIEYGNPLEIVCILRDTRKYNSSSLMFFHNDEPVPEQFLDIVNETSLRLYVKKPEPSKSMYYCKQRQAHDNVGVCLNTVFVGKSPSEIKNFSCIPFNWEYLKCEWTPEELFVTTNYSLTYILPTKYKFQALCPKITENSCTWNISTIPPYRLPYEIYNFKLYVENMFGNKTFMFKLSHYASLIPDKPHNLTVIEATTNSLKIKWSRPTPLLGFPSIMYRVEYQSQFDSKEDWNIIEPKNKTDNGSVDTILNIVDLKFAHTYYDIRVFLRSGTAEPPYNWSQPATVTARTLKTVPQKPPESDIGSYEITNENKDTRDIYIYWQQIPKYMENGDNFDYKVISVIENGIKRNITPVDVTKSYAKFNGLSNNNYTFRIVSSNCEGSSLKSSEVFVPSKSISPSLPQSVIKLAFDNLVYEVSWGAPNDSQEVDSYTVFWCNHKQDRPFQCNGFLNWTRVPSYITAKNITLPDEAIYQFAVSANTKSMSSGMAWASCTILPNQDGASGKVKTIWVDKVAAKSIELSWKLDCSDRIGVIQGYYIDVCPILEPMIPVCQEPPKKFEEHPSRNDVMHSNVTGLKPYTTYMINITAFSKTWKGFPSDPKYATTTEAAPDEPPRDVRIIGVTNTSITVAWSPPEPSNGHVRDYNIYYMGNSSYVAASNNCSSCNATIHNLESGSPYHISIAACTVECSPRSPEVKVSTKIGTPGVIGAPTVTMTDTKLMVNWSSPNSLGPLNYYRVRVQRFSDSFMISEDIYNITRLEWSTDEKFCSQEKANLKLKVSVSAVNDVPPNITYQGPWSKHGESNCVHSSDGLGVNMIIVISTVGVLCLFLVCVLFGFLIRCAWSRYKYMNDLEARLPRSLATINDTKKDIGDNQLSLHVWTPAHLQDNNVISNKPPPDQELLLDSQRKELLNSVAADSEEIGDVERESSGCGSGHGSVSSSINGGPQISSDSGTEADQRASSPDEFSNSSRGICNLRQRIVPNNASEGYSRVAPPPSGYVTMPTNVMLGRGGYVPHPPHWTNANNQPSKGYVHPSPSSAQVSSSDTYCLLGWKPPESQPKSNHECALNQGTPINRDYIADSSSI